MNLTPRATAFLVLLSAPWMAHPSQVLAQTESQIISRHCSIEWPSDNEMRAYCVREQRKATQELASARRSRLGMDRDAFTTALNRCQLEWPTDFQMQSHCLKEQARGYSSVKMAPAPGAQTVKERAQIKAHCRDEWSGDFAMLAWCEREQSKALAFLKSSNRHKKAECRREWPRDYEMQAFCVRN